MLSAHNVKYSITSVQRFPISKLIIFFILQRNGHDKRGFRNRKSNIEPIPGEFGKDLGSQRSYSNDSKPPPIKQLLEK
jgi:hypothetical protein